MLPGAVQERIDVFSEAGAVPEHLTRYVDVELPGFVATFRGAVEQFLAEAQTSQGPDATGLKNILSADYDFKLAVYNGFVAAYNADRIFEIFPPNDDSNQFERLSNPLRDLMGQTPTAGTYSSYQQLGDEELPDPEFDAVYTELFGTYTGMGLSVVEAQDRTLETMRDSVLDWIERVDLDYLRGYQAQVRQYLNTAQQAGVVVRIADDTAVLDTGDPGTRPMRLSDLREVYLNSFYMDVEFFDLTLNGDQTDFLTPEEVFASDGFQELVGYATAALNDLPDHEQGTVVEALKDVVETQYSMLATPGSSSQPIMVALPTFVSEYFSLCEEHFAGLSEPELRPLPNWKDDAVVPGELPDDTYRAQNYLVVPNTLFSQQGTHSVTRDVSYAFEDGTEAAPGVAQAVEFTCLVDAITGEAEWVPEGQTGTLPALTHPAVTHPAAHATVLAPETEVPAVAVTPDSNNSTLQVIFPLDYRVELRYEDGRGATLRDAAALTGRWNTGYTATAPGIDGYLLSSESSVPGMFGTGPASIVFARKRVATAREG